ncbi:MAG: hypothetical protein RL527_2077 [Planctomycetota bacterium]
MPRAGQPLRAALVVCVVVGGWRGRACRSTWRDKTGVKTLSLEPVDPGENGKGKCLNGKLRDGRLNGEFVYAVTKARLLIERRREHRRRVRPHIAIGYGPQAAEVNAARPPSLWCGRFDSGFLIG